MSGSVAVTDFDFDADSGSQSSPPQAIFPLYDFQKRVVSDPARLIGWLKARQVGGSTTATLKITLDAVEHGESWRTMSRSQRQSESLLAKVAKHALAINEYATQVLRQSRVVDPEQISAHRVPFCNGASVEAVPCDPDTTVGETCNWLLDEFALYPRSKAIFGVIKPSIMHGKKMMVLSSPRGRRGKFFDLWRMYEQMGADSGWSWHKTTIEDAIRDGFCPKDERGRPMTFEQFRDQEIRDIGLEMWLQEYMCVFSDKLTAFLPYRVIVACSSANIPLVRTLDALQTLDRDLYIGVDIGRRRDLTVIWVLSRSGDNFTTESVFVLDNTPFEEQARILRSVLASGHVAGCCIDQGGIGMQLAEMLAETFPGIVEQVSFTNANKAEMAHRLKLAMEAGNFWMPDDDDLKADFASVERDVTDSGLIRIAAPHSGTGHGDRFWAAALAMRATNIFRPFELVLAI